MAPTYSAKMASCLHIPCPHNKVPSQHRQDWCLASTTPYKVKKDRPYSLIIACLCSILPGQWTLDPAWRFPASVASDKLLWSLAHVLILGSNCTTVRCISASPSLTCDCPDTTHNQNTSCYTNVHRDTTVATDINDEHWLTTYNVHIRIPKDTIVATALTK